MMTRSIGLPSCWQTLCYTLTFWYSVWMTWLIFKYHGIFMIKNKTIHTFLILKYFPSSNRFLTKWMPTWNSNPITYHSIVFILVIFAIALNGSTNFKSYEQFFQKTARFLCEELAWYKSIVRFTDINLRPGCNEFVA